MEGLEVHAALTVERKVVKVQAPAGKVEFESRWGGVEELLNAV